MFLSGGLRFLASAPAAVMTMRMMAGATFATTAEGSSRKAKEEKRYTGFQLFQKEMIVNAPGVGLEKSKAVREQWKALSPNDKEAYKTRASGDDGLKKRLLSAYTLYVKDNFDKKLPLGEAMKKLASEWKTLPEEKKKVFQARSKAGEGATLLKPRNPKTKVVTPYSIFMRESFSTAAGATLGEKAKDIAAKWKALTVKEKGMYQAQAVKDSRQVHTPKKRAISGYQLFVTEKLRITKPITPDVMKNAALEWKAFSEDQRNAYKEKAVAATAAAAAATEAEVAAAKAKAKALKKRKASAAAKAAAASRK